MKKIFFISTVFLMYVATYAQSPIGTWKTIDDKSGKEKSYVKIYETKSGKLQGDVVKILTPGKEDIKCTECDGDRKDKPINGMTIIWGLEKDGDEWSDGKILDPNSGRLYKCNIKLKGSNQLEVRGYLGISLLGRTQTWERVE